MNCPPVDFDALTEPVETRVAAGLVRIATALKARAWKAAGPARLTPTQGQALTLLRGVGDGMRLSALAETLAVTPATASDSIASLVSKGLVTRNAAAGDRRAAAFSLTAEGMALADQVASWPDFLSRAVETLDDAERLLLYRVLIKMIRALQEAGDIPIQRMCVSCRYFRPNTNPGDPDRPHVCAYVGAPFGDRHLRLDCPEQQPVPDAESAALWARFTTPPPFNAKET